MTRLRALLATLRIANAPSVISNVWLGFMLGVYYWGGFAVFEVTENPSASATTNASLLLDEALSPIAALALLVASGLCLFFSGNLANDWHDRDWDRRHRPERALPRGLFPPSIYLAAALLLGVTGLGLAALVSARCLGAAMAILALVAIYTWLHKRSRWAVVPMGLCRASLLVLGFLCFLPGFPVAESDSTNKFAPMLHQMAVEAWLKSLAFLATHALGLLIYIAGLSLAARYESTEHPPHGMVLLSRAMLFLPLAALSAWWMPYYPLWASLGLLPFAFWLSLSLTRFRKPVPRFVSALLAGIPLIDFIAALPLAGALTLPDQSLHEQPLLLATVLVPWLAFGAALLLQKVAPAT